MKRRICQGRAALKQQFFRPADTGHKTAKRKITDHLAIDKISADFYNSKRFNRERDGVLGSRKRDLKSSDQKTSQIFQISSGARSRGRRAHFVGRTQPQDESHGVPDPAGSE